MAIAQHSLADQTPAHELLYSTIDNLVVFIRQQTEPDPLSILDAISGAAKQLSSSLLRFTPESVTCSFIGNPTLLTRQERAVLPARPNPTNATSLLHPYPARSAAAQTRSELIPDEDWLDCDLRKHRLAAGTDEFALITALFHDGVPHTHTSAGSDQVSPLWLCLQVDVHHNGWPGPRPDFSPLLMLLRVAAPLYRILVHDMLIHRQSLLSQLSRPQREIIPYLLDGLSEQQIADTLDRSKHTVHDHIKTIYSRWHVNSRIQLLSTWLIPRLSTHPHPTQSQPNIVLSERRTALRQAL